jgi:hypothetical protein
MLHAVLILALGAGGSMHLAATPIEVVDLPADRGRFLGQHLTQQLSLKPRLKVTSPDDIARILGLERQRQLLGCSQTDCVMELAGALGVDGIIASSLARVGSGYVLNVRVVGARRGELLTAWSGHAATEDGVVALVETAASEVAEALSPTPTNPKKWAFLPGVVGAALAIGGGVSFGVSMHDARIIQQRTATDAANLQSVAAEGKLAQSLGLAGLISGGALVLAALGIVLFAPPQTSVVTRDGAAVAMAWRLP